MSARPIPCIVVAYTAAWNPCAFWTAGDPGTPGAWTPDPAEATALTADEAETIAGMWDDYARSKGSWNSYRHEAASNFQKDTTQ